MKIALVGYGKMGHIIARVAKDCGHEIVATIDTESPDATNIIDPGDGDALKKIVRMSGADGVIEFSHPKAVFDNLKALVTLGIPIICGTTGWHNKEGEIASAASIYGAVVMTSNNFSIGVNIFYKIIEAAIKAQENFSEYDIAVTEVHHNQKADSPSGTALEIANIILNNTKKKNEVWADAFHERPKPEDLHVSSTRVGNVPGTHTVIIDGPADTIELTHRARGREGFALGAVRSLERVVAGLEKGSLTRGRLYHMEDIF